ncbi:Cysteine-rich receptor-like protein kinase 42 [Acorus calamus]|uniref:Cysteine-rich receptor-like protein kinase 42 n=1 Tax=Acorus calamus TaxID=4465 RepID=A0AAV9DMK2_ACOCL|nr:Cysteine-rich receptor-like protein kinase 42 [Acorus calamus]
MQSLSDSVSSRGFATSSTPSIAGNATAATMYGLAQCHSDLSSTDCMLCFAECRTRLPRCLPADSARIFLDGCFLRYGVSNFFNQSVDPVNDKAACGTDNSTVGGTYTANVRECLVKAAKEATSCLPNKEGRGLNAGCYLRYDNYKFFGNSGGGKGSLSTGVIIGIVAASIVLVFLIILGIFTYRRRIRKQQEKKQFGKLPLSIAKSHLNFKYEVLEKATNFFDNSRKLGQGGAGSVYKGTLPDGRTVAVKRLFFNTRQWVDEFFNEVDLVSKIEHKNLVKLLGCSIEGPESLLVYEYLPNKSLDQFLFDKDYPQVLSWEQRFHVIVGAAEGLAYLHAGSITRIIHRDIKGSNLLLDENLNAKIADFGLARRLSADKSHLSTGVAGTLGYMAPEYLVRGVLTEKADVYSFGVLVLEVVCGRKNNVYSQESSSVLQIVWRHFQSDTLTEAVDQRLNNNFPEKQASDVLQVGLLCTQASVVLRPSMSDVIQMLTSAECTIPLPMQPPFLNTSIANQDNSKSSTGPSSQDNYSSSVSIFEPR